MAALLFLIRPAAAQSPTGYYYETFRYGYNPGYYARRVTVPAYYGGMSLGPNVTRTKTSPGLVADGAYLHYAPSSTAQTAPRTSYLAVTGAGTAATTGTARLELQVPEGAEVWFGGVRTEQTGTQRTFESPPLAPGRDYAYTIRVVWKADGHEAAENREVSVRADDRLTESFPAAAGDE